MHSKQKKARGEDEAESSPSGQNFQSLTDVEASTSGLNHLDKEQIARDRLIRALANPLEVRLDVELIRDLGVSEEQARAWMEEPGFRASVEKELERRRGEARPAVWRALIREALRGSFQHIKLYLELAGDLQPPAHEAESMGSPVVIIRPGQMLGERPFRPLEPPEAAQPMAQKVDLAGGEK
jgi:hypothetical protein